MIKSEVVENTNVLTGRLWKRITNNWGLYVLLLPAIALLIMFTYQPMLGIIIAFKDFKPSEGIIGSAWAGFDHFVRFFNSFKFLPTLKNTLLISIYSILITFPVPIVLALLCNQLRRGWFKKVFQVSTYLPHFISTVVMCGMIILFLSPSTGIIAHFLSYFSVTLPNLMGQASAFSSIYVWTEAWQHVGWDSILYIAALSAIDPTLYEVATIDGASKWQKMKNIDLPLLLPTATIMFILRAGSVMSIGFEKVYLLQNSLNIASSEVIATYVYKMGLVNNQYSLSAAISLFNNVINLVLLITVNQIAKKLSKTSLV